MSRVKVLDGGKILVKNCRLSYANVFKTAVIDGKDSGKFSGIFLFPKSDEETYNELMSIIAKMKTESKLKIKDDDLFLKDGDYKDDKDGYADNWYISASNSKRPTVMDRDKTPLVDEDGVIYSGCYVDVIISPWLQNNNYGKKINSNLLAVRFLKDGEPLGNMVRVTEDDFDDADDSDIDDL